MIDGDARGAIVVPAPDLQAEVRFFTEQLGLRVDTLVPADDPARITMSGLGLCLILERDLDLPAPTLRLIGPHLAQTLVSPAGTRVELLPTSLSTAAPKLRPELLHHSQASLPWVTGRAGMLYRDLIPGRLGGGFVASRIRIPKGGPVPDSVHHHAICFQLIYCAQGWVKVVYQDQGEPFVLTAGDCVLQPPGIRHRVLESSDELEVVEVSCPAQHDTHFDHELELPNGSKPGGDYGGQQFVHHRAAEVSWETASDWGGERRTTGIAEATRRQYSVHTWRPSQDAIAPREEKAAFVFLHVLHGSTGVEGLGSDVTTLREGDSLVIPRGQCWAASKSASRCEILAVSVHHGP